MSKPSSNPQCGCAPRIAELMRRRKVQEDEIERLRGGVERIALAAAGGDYDLKYIVRECKELLAADEPKACTNDRKSCKCHKCMTYRSIADATGWEE